MNYLISFLFVLLSFEAKAQSALNVVLDDELVFAAEQINDVLIDTWTGTEQEEINLIRNHLTPKKVKLVIKFSVPENVCTEEQEKVIDHYCNTDTTGNRYCKPIKRKVCITRSGYFVNYTQSLQLNFEKLAPLKEGERQDLKLVTRATRNGELSNFFHFEIKAKTLKVKKFFAVNFKFKAKD